MYPQALPDFPALTREGRSGTTGVAFYRARRPAGIELPTPVRAAGRKNVSGGIIGGDFLKRIHELFFNLGGGAVEHGHDRVRRRDEDLEHLRIFQAE